MNETIDLPIGVQVIWTALPTGILTILFFVSGIVGIYILSWLFASGIGCHDDMTIPIFITICLGVVLCIAFCLLIQYAIGVLL